MDILRPGYAPRRPRSLVNGHCLMFLSRTIIVLAVAAVSALPITANARSRSQPDVNVTAQIVGFSPTLAPFQHVRFCLRYPNDCKASTNQGGRIELDEKIFGLLKRINRNVNLAIAPRPKIYGSNLADSWTIDPISGDCNDYAVTKRHQLLENGLPSSALRLSVVRTASGIGHLILIVTTTQGDVVMDNLTDAIRPWQTTDYQWLKIQSNSDPRFWNEIRPTALTQAAADRKIDNAGR